ncbi:MAG: hypothetical protein OEU36_20350 [Gammaproteobacteria bacterium]|nr:hypothetical protein [Gammaproteobacteria bacterium]
MAMSGGAVSPKRERRSFIELDLGEFELIIRGQNRATSDRIALEQIPDLFQRGLRIIAFRYSLIADVQLTEVEVHYSNRRSRGRITLRIPEVPKPIAWLLLGHTLVFGDYELAEDNLQWLHDKSVEITDSTFVWVKERLEDDDIDFDLTYNRDIVLGRPPKAPDDEED